MCKTGDKNRLRCWRGVTKDKGFAGRSTPTWATAGAENPGSVGVAWRRTKALQGGRRQHGRRTPWKRRRCWRGEMKDKGFTGRPTPTWAAAGAEKAPVLAWRNEGQRLCGEAHANMGCRRRGKSGPCWRGVAKDKGFAGRPTPTWAAARRGKGPGVGVAWRRTKALRGGPRQHGLPHAVEKAPVLAWRGEGQRFCGEAHANMGNRAPRKSPGSKANNLISPKKRNTSQKVVLYKNHMPHWHMVLQMHR